LSFQGLGVTGDIKAAAEQIKHLYELFVKSDCTMVEVSGMVGHSLTPFLHQPHSLGSHSGGLAC